MKKEETFVDDELENRVINHSNKYIYMPVKCHF